MRFAIIDLGTNTFKLLIIEQLDNGIPEIIFKNKLPVKLGEGGLSQNIIARPAYNRGINALVEHKKVIDEYTCEHIFTFATSGIRSTKNGGKFVDEIKTKLNLDINIIDGMKEADYIYSGVQKALEIPSNSCIVDIGGGSTEFVVCNKDEIFWKKSYKLGVSRLYEMFKPNDPLKKEGIENVEAHLKIELEDLFEQLKKYNVKHLIGSSGSFKSFAKVIGEKNGVPVDDFYGEIDMSEFFALHKELISMNVFQRLNMSGMEAMRADMIPMASVLVNFILQEHEFSNLHVSRYSLKEGVIEEIANSLIKK